MNYDDNKTKIGPMLLFILRPRTGLILIWLFLFVRNKLLVNPINGGHVVLLQCGSQRPSRLNTVTPSFINDVADKWEYRFSCLGANEVCIARVKAERGTKLTTG